MFNGSVIFHITLHNIISTSVFMYTMSVQHAIWRQQALEQRVAGSSW